MNDEKDGMKVFVNTNGCKTEFSQEFKACEPELKRTEQSKTTNANPEFSVIQCNSETKAINFSYKVITWSVLIFSIVLGIFSVIIATTALKMTSSDSLKSFVPIMAFSAFFVLTTMISLVVISKITKPFAKMEFLRNLIESNQIDRELIKKYCDTLAEL